MRARKDLARKLERALQSTLIAKQTVDTNRILGITPHLATDNLERFQVVFEVQSPVPFQA